MKQLLRKQLLLLAMVCATTAYAQTTDPNGNYEYYDRYQIGTNGEIIYDEGSQEAWVTTVDATEWERDPGVTLEGNSFVFGDGSGQTGGPFVGVTSPNFDANSPVRLELTLAQSQHGANKSDFHIYFHYTYNNGTEEGGKENLDVYFDLKGKTPYIEYDKDALNVTTETVGKAYHITIEFILPTDFISNGKLQMVISAHGGMKIGASADAPNKIDVFSDELVLRDDWDNTQRLIKNAGKKLKKVIIVRSYDKGWYTLSLPFDLTMKQFQRRYMASFDKAKADYYTWKEDTCAEIWHYDALDEGSKVMHFRKHNTEEYVLKAGVPYLIYVPEDISKTLYDFTRTSDEQVSSTDYKQGEEMMVFTNITIPDSLKTTDNDNKEVLNTKMSKVTRGNTAYAFASNLGATDIKKIADANKVYYLHTDTLGENPELYTPNAASITNDTIITDGTIKEVKVMKIKGFRAYFISPLEPTQAKKSLRFSDDNVVTAIDKINVRQEENMPIFNLQGQHMNNDLKNLPRGIYIMNGKKYVVK